MRAALVGGSAGEDTGPSLPTPPAR
jgi:hypothetical protein